MVSAEEQMGIVFLNMFMLGIGATLDVVGLLFWMRRIPPNTCIGINIKAMGNNRDIWYEVNQYAGRLFTIEGVFLVTLSLLFMALPYGFTFLARILTFLAIFAVSLVAVVFLSLARARAFSSAGSSLSYDFDSL
mmetsp:Transcript_18341/g.25704  ORF Transcript_18341/g.25704 Transcript_18341/m.25704 type:complete len:134 (+) Transcript_18341:137-538(+)|eukprot:CAMPEP_0168561502 /NCGR_PEP_ID=MMETSP0413-20121227/11628_1 /TAXON_ID=136452 /ORGANISM="Filamoeba nolandi, Strain NC-AS-23-1" /LENGTH=133 /DNA_ID=CAMNT_0008592875 /DNA_START=74 /DNA_END=475 /DNA_ORIENTATION=+